MDRQKALGTLKAHGQEHVMEGFDELTNEQKAQLIRQIGEVDWETIALVGKDKEESKGDIEPLGAAEEDKKSVASLQ